MSDNDTKNNIFELEGDALDEALMAAIEQTEEEEKEHRAQKIKEDQLKAEKLRQEAIERQERLEKIEQLKKSLPNEGRRYFIMAEEAECDEDSMSAAVTGTVYGTCKKDDSVFLYRNDGRAVGSRVLSVERFNGQVYEPSDEASQTKCRIKIAVDYKALGLNADNAVPKFSVVTSVRPPVKDQNGKISVENPSLSGLMFNFAKYNKDKEFFNHLMNNIVNGRFLVPIVAPKNGKPEEVNGKKKLELILMPKKDDPNTRVLPLFTDIQAFMLWRKGLSADTKPAVTVMGFKDAAKFVERDSFDLAFNPAGPVSVGLPAKHAAAVAAAADKAASDAASGKRVIKENVADASKVVVGPPRPGQETDMVRGALVNYAMSDRDIRKAGLMYIMRSGRISYLVVADAPKEKQSSVFAGILAALKPHLGAVKTVDFSLLSEAPFAKDYFKKQGWDYLS